MALPSSGPLTLTDIQTEFGGSNPIGLNEYYAGGTYVPSGTTGTNGAVPASGAISIWSFYGTSAVNPNIGVTWGTRTDNAWGLLGGITADPVNNYLYFLPTGATTWTAQYSTNEGQNWSSFGPFTITGQNSPDSLGMVKLNNTYWAFGQSTYQYYSSDGVTWSSVRRIAVTSYNSAGSNLLQRNTNECMYVQSRSNYNNAVLYTYDGGSTWNSLIGAGPKPGNTGWGGQMLAGIVYFAPLNVYFMGGEVGVFTRFNPLTGADSYILMTNTVAGWNTTLSRSNVWSININSTNTKILVGGSCAKMAHTPDTYTWVFVSTLFTYYGSPADSSGNYRIRQSWIGNKWSIFVLVNTVTPVYNDIWYSTDLVTFVRTGSTIASSGSTNQFYYMPTSKKYVGKCPNPAIGMYSPA